MSPAFVGAYAAAPPSIRVGDKVYERDAARSTAERVWYLAAVAMQDPKAVYLVGNQGANDVALAWDRTQVETDSRVVAAKAAKEQADAAVIPARDAATKAQSDFTAVKSKAAGVQQQITAMNAQIADLEARRASVTQIHDFGDFMGAAATLGASKLAPIADIEIRLGSARNHVSQLKADLSAINVEGAKAAADQAQADLGQKQGEAKAAADQLEQARVAVQKELRDQENAELAKKNAEAAAEQAARAAENEQKWQDYYASQGGGAFGDYGGELGGSYIEPEWQSGDWASTDPDAELAEPEYLDEPGLDELADLYGDEDEAHKMAWLNGEPIIGVNTVVSPYSIDAYYDGDNLEEHPVFGADTAELVGGIIAGVLVMAPAIINAVAPPPSKDSTGANTTMVDGKLTDAGGQGSSGSSAKSSSSTFNIDTLLEKLGLKKTINDAAASAGASAGQQGGASVDSTVGKYLGTSLFIGAALLLVKALR